MPWPFVGRTEQLDRIRTVFTESRPGPVMLFGPPGMGRSRLLTEALARAPLTQDDVVLRLEPAGPEPFSALRRLLPPGFIHSSSPDNDVTGAADEMAGRLSGRRPVIAFDDAHLADQHTMRVLRHLRGAHGALVLVTAAGSGALPHGPDPLDCLRYDLGTRTLRLPPLSADEVSRILTGALGGPVRGSTAAAVHASTGGNPGLLHGMVVRDRLADAMVPHDGMHQLAPAVNGLPAPRRSDPVPGSSRPPGHPAGEPVTGHLTEAVGTAWRDLVLDQADELCRLAAWQGLGGLVAPVWAMVLMLRGQVAAGRQVLDTHAGADGSPRVVMTRAMVVGLGQRQVATADALLVDAARLDARHRERLLACRAWLLAVTGTSTAAPDVVDPGEDREAALFCRAARAVTALNAGRAGEAVPHLRRALAAADGLRDELPWFPPYLTACLIDALLLAGRISEATAEAAEFHAGRRGCGWAVAVAFDSLLTTRGLVAAPEVLG
jgi:hypothetical protein